MAAADLAAGVQPLSVAWRDWPISVRRRPEGIAITYQRDLRVWEGGAARQFACDLGLAGGAGTSPAAVGRAATASPD